MRGQPKENLRVLVSKVLRFTHSSKVCRPIYPGLRLANETARITAQFYLHLKIIMANRYNLFSLKCIYLLLYYVYGCFV